MGPTQRRLLVEMFNHLKFEAHKTAKEKGWWDSKRTFGDQIALMHSELSEALEAYRTNGLLEYENDGKPEGVTTELADVLIRIFDICEEYRLPLGQALLNKLAYNKTRSQRHGGKLL